MILLLIGSSSATSTRRPDSTPEGFNLGDTLTSFSRGISRPFVGFGDLEPSIDEVGPVEDDWDVLSSWTRKALNGTPESVTDSWPGKRGEPSGITVREGSSSFDAVLMDIQVGRQEITLSSSVLT